MNIQFEINSKKNVWVEHKKKNLFDYRQNC